MVYFLQWASQLRKTPCFLPILQKFVLNSQRSLSIQSIFIQLQPLSMLSLVLNPLMHLFLFLDQFALVLASQLKQRSGFLPKQSRNIKCFRNCSKGILTLNFRYSYNQLLFHSSQNQSEMIGPYLLLPAQLTCQIKPWIVILFLFLALLLMTFSLLFARSSWYVVYVCKSMQNSQLEQNYQKREVQRMRAINNVGKIFSVVATISIFFYGYILFKTVMKLSHKTKCRLSNHRQAICQPEQQVRSKISLLLPTSFMASYCFDLLKKSSRIFL